MQKRFAMMTVDGPVETDGTPVRIKVGDKVRRFFIHDIGGDAALSCAVSGLRFGTLNAIKVRNLAARGHHAGMSDRQAAIALVNDMIERVGLEKVEHVMDNAIAKFPD